MKRNLFCALLLTSFCLSPHFTFSQFSPPGLGRINTAGWFAVGAKQDLSTEKKITSTTYLGIGRTSNPSNYNPFERSTIYVINEEVANQFSKRWKYSGALSYRWQNRYKSTVPFELDTPSGRQELRIYGRLSYLTTLGIVHFSFTYRPEMRLFYNPDFTHFEESEEFRSRLSSKASLNINSSKTQKIITSIELLFAADKTEYWGTWSYRESRFCFYYSLTLPKQNVTLNMGYMNDLIGRQDAKDAHYLAMDILVTNLFGR